MMTFSINIGQNTESTAYNIIGATSVDLSQILYGLEDNINKEINPKNIRDSILTAWSSVSFKETSKSNIFYIGLDTTNPLDRNVRNKILIGKRNYNNIDIMTNTLLSNYDGDIFFYNTKLDSVSNSKTRISILSGTNSLLYNTSSYLQSQVIGNYETLSLDIVNDNNISFSNNGTSSNIYLNGIGFPTVKESLGYTGLTPSANGRVLFYNNGNLYWDDISYKETGYVGVTGSQLDIYGTPVNLNGYPLEFTDSRGCPIEIGDIKIGSTFNSQAICEMLRRVIYNYLPPLCSVSVLPPYSSGYVEVGTSPSIKLAYTIYKRTLPTMVTSVSYMIPGYHPAITTNTYKTEVGTVSGIIISPVSATSSIFKVTVSDGLTQSVSTASVTGIYPYFYGISILSNMTSFGLSTLTKLVEPSGTKMVDLIGSGYIYFIYDNSYSPLTNVVDEFGGTLSVASYSIINLSSPTGLWSSKNFKVYQWGLTQSIGPTSVNYEFII